MVKPRNIGIAAQVTSPLLARSVDEQLEAVRVDLVVDVAPHLRHEGISAALRELCYGDIIH